VGRIVVIEGRMWYNQATKTITPRAANAGVVSLVYWETLAMPKYKPDSSSLQLTLFSETLDAPSEDIKRGERRAQMREYMRQRRRDNPAIAEAERARQRERYAADPEKARQTVKKSREKHAAIVKRRMAEYREANREALREMNRLYYKNNADAMKERARLRRKAYPEDKRRAQRKRKAMRNNTLYDLTRAQHDAILARPCEFCGSTEYPTLAHDIAVSKGGDTTLSNVFCLCRSCNSRMKTKTKQEVLQLMAEGKW
jgi:5-methylcytosine-specific restriction endonuclease McrA